MNPIMLPLCLLFTLLAGCNLFNPSGEGESPSSAKEWIEQGNMDLRDQKFVAAEKCFRQALKQDSSYSEAWRGLAKAESGRYLPITDVLDRVESIEDSGAAIFWQITTSERNMWYQAFIRLDSVFEQWYVLDSLGRTEMDQYDRSDRNTVMLFAGVLGIWDTNQDGVIDSTDFAIDKLISYVNNIAGGIRPEFCDEELWAMITDTTGQIDSSQIEVFNSVLVQTDAVLDEIKNNSALDSNVQVLIGDIAGENNYLSFYQTSNASDDDFDGCIDEEVPDGMDNDGDGLVDEDSRVGWRESNWPVALGAYAMIAVSDGIRGDRLLNPNNGIGIEGEDSATTLIYGDAVGHIEMYRHFWDSEDPRYETLHWKYAEADSLIIFRDSIKSMPWGKNRVEAGCELLGGCWCLIKEKFCSGEECRVP